MSLLVLLIQKDSEEIVIMVSFITVEVFLRQEDLVLGQDSEPLRKVKRCLLTASKVKRNYMVRIVLSIDSNEVLKVDFFQKTVHAQEIGKQPDGIDLFHIAIHHLEDPIYVASRGSVSIY